MNITKARKYVMRRFPGRRTYLLPDKQIWAIYFKLKTVTSTKATKNA